MTAQSDLPQRIRDELRQVLREHDRDAQIQVRRNSIGWLHLNVTTTFFEGKSPIDRERQIDAILGNLNLSLGSFPFSGYVLQTPREAADQSSPEPVQLPLWSEILMMPEPEFPVLIDDDDNNENKIRRPFVVTFYSFKGGVGRSTALGLVAGILASRGHKVVMVDFDLEAPGLSFMFPQDLSTSNKYGVLDYIHQRYLTPEQDVPVIADCIQQVETPTRGELYLIPAGEYDEGYIHRLADLDVRLLYQREVNPIHQLLENIKIYLDPDVILIDARTGFTEMGAIALFDKADLGMICFSPTGQNFAGLEWVVKAASKQRSYHGIPDLRFVLTPIPAVAQSQQQVWVAHAAEWITKHWGIPPSVTVDELYYQVPYNPIITTLTSLSGEMPPGLLAAYEPIAETISASLSEKTPAIPKLADNRQKILAELNFRAAIAQEMKPEDIPAIFQRTGDFSKFLQDRTWLVRGAKGTGKTLLFRLFVERSDHARRMAKSDADLHNVQFIPGHGRPELRSTLLNSTDLESYEKQAGEKSWGLFWLNYMLLQLVTNLPELQDLANLDPELLRLGAQAKPRHADIVTWLVKRALWPEAAPLTTDELLTIDRWLLEHHQRVWLLYDELDVGFGRDNERRRRALESLLSWWMEMGSALNAIIPKIFLREDIWNNLNFTNKTYFSTRFVLLRWEEEDLWRLVLRQALDSSPIFANLVSQQLGIEKEGLNNLEQGQLRRSLYPLWGERMGREKKAFTYNWVRNRISDSRNNRFPRSLIQLLQKAVNLEKVFVDRNTYDAVLRPRALIEALPFASEQRVAEVRNEYPEFDNLLDKLEGDRSPIALEHLGEIWGLDRDSGRLKVLVASMVEAGILQEYLRSPDNTDTQRYAVAELYLYGLKMKRLGQR
ncbi:MAG TPA: hypothetical protein VKV40_14740 [Ktedonobacteraceae bacterium]|nr:hypothetical protein [Ktedonobacteraceae bacterium]